MARPPRVFLILARGTYRLIGYYCASCVGKGNCKPQAQSTNTNFGRGISRMLFTLRLRLWSRSGCTQRRIEEECWQSDVMPIVERLPWYHDHMWNYGSVAFGWWDRFNSLRDLPSSTTLHPRTYYLCLCLCLQAFRLYSSEIDSSYSTTTSRADTKGDVCYHSLFYKRQTSCGHNLTV